MESSFAFILLLLAKDGLHSSLSVTQGYRGGGGFFFSGCRMGWVVLANYSYAFYRVTGVKIKAGSEWGAVRVCFMWNKESCRSLLRPARTAALS